MATTHTHHRTPSHPKRSKPAPLKRASKSQTKVPQVQPRKEEEPEDDLMAASFLNFCTVCEKQIIVPNNSILYCSESCRKKDNTKTITFEPSPPPTPYFHRFSFDDVSPSRDIVPPRSPTQAPSKRLSYGFSETSDDEAPEWNEKESKESEATRYLRTFSSTDITAQRSRPNYHRSSTSTVVSTTSTTPSLSHTPTSSVSISMPYTPSNRPLPRRNPHGSSYGTRSIDLVNPFTIAAQPTTAPSSFTQWSLKSGPSCKTSTGVAEGELEWFEKKIPDAASPSQGSLKQLFAFSAMQAPPSSTASTMRPSYS
ncbi:hypothetical protein SLS56_000120 [Neofusicoccum ribis]|uniref:Life-span regulatory factor n=1 Tax=Neofusicoccum ribis TaxID=45134 RepID=A0ABR3TFP3_9PEZI